MKQLLNAYLGRRTWKKIKYEYRPDDGTVILLMCERDKEFNSMVMSLLDNYCKRKYWSRVIVIARIGWEEGIEFKINTPYEIVICGEKKIKNLIKYYCLVDFFANFIVVSIQEPDGNTVGRLINSNKMDIKELINASIFV